VAFNELNTSADSRLELKMIISFVQNIQI